MVIKVSKPANPMPIETAHPRADIQIMNSIKINSSSYRDYQFWQNERQQRRKAYQKAKKFQLIVSPRFPPKITANPDYVDIRNRSCACRECGPSSKKLTLKTVVKFHIQQRARRRFRQAVWAVVGILAYKEQFINKLRKKKLAMPQRRNVLVVVVETPSVVAPSPVNRRLVVSQSPKQVKKVSPQQKQLELVQYKINQSRPFQRYLDNYIREPISKTKFSIQTKCKQIPSPTSHYSPRSTTKHLISDTSVTSTNRFRRYTEGEPKLSHHNSPVQELLRKSRYPFWKRSSKA